MFARRLMPVMAVLSCSAIALAADTTMEDLKAQISALQSKVEALEAKQASTAEANATAERVLADAERRSQPIQAEDFTAGYNKGKFLIQSADGNFVWHPFLQWQVRHTANYRENAQPDGDSDTNVGFDVRRLKMGFDGNVFSPDLTYHFQWATDRNTGTPGLEDGWAKYKFADDWAFQAGQFKDPLYRESLVSSMRQLAADRSLLANVLGGNDNYIVGANLIYNPGRLRLQAAYTNGFGSASSSFVQPIGSPDDVDYAPAGNRDYDLGLVTRAEYMLIGDPETSWTDYSQFSAVGTKTDLLILGAAGEADPVGDANVFWYTADAQWLPAAVDGLSIFGAFLGRQTELGTPAAGADDSYSDWGALAQAGYLINDRFEPFVRYDYVYAGEGVMTDARADAYGTRAIQEYTAGLNYYLHGQAMKLTIDLTYLPDGSPVGVSGAGILPQAEEGDQWLTRVQFQLLI